MTQTEKAKKTLAVHLHVYYAEQLSKILNHLKSLEDVDYDLFVTIVQKNEHLEAQIKQFNKAAQIYIVSNKGYDVGPFIDFLHKINLDNYDYILKIHTKGEKSLNITKINRNKFNSKLWKQILFDALLKNKETVRKNLKLFK